jgi:GDP-L-fucose synthase
MINLTKQHILLTGKNGFLGTHVYGALLKRGIPESNIYSPSSKELDLKIWSNCVKATQNIDIVIHLAAKIGGIGFNERAPGEIFYDNALMGIQLMEAARQASVKKMVTVGTVCAYPKHAPIPFKEDSLWDGYPEEITAPYGMAKKMLLVQGQAYYEQYGFKSVFLLPVNLYGPGDHFDSINSHVMPALIKRIVDAKMNKYPSIEVWGTGKATREFLYVDDAARGIILATEKYEDQAPINLGSGEEISIANLVQLICRLVDFQGKIMWNTKKPDGVMRRKLNVTKAYKAFGFKAKTSLEFGLKQTIRSYMDYIASH